MKFILVTETYPPEVNGVAMTLSHIVAELASRGHSVVVVRPGQRGEPADQALGSIEHCTVTRFPLPFYKGLHFGVPFIGRLKRLFRRVNPDLIHIATEGPLGLSALRTAKSLGIPLSSSFHTNFHAYSKYYGLGLLKRFTLGYLRYLHNSTAATFVPSKDMLRNLEDADFRNLHLLGRGIDTDLFHPAKRDEALRASWGVTPEQKVAIYVGRIAREKNISLTIRAFEAMRGVIPDLKLVIVGDGPERSRFEAACPDIHFAGMQKNDDLARHYASGDIFLFGSVTETFGNVVTEAMASGLAVLAFDYAAPGRYIINGENGFLVSYGDEDAFVERARQVAETSDGWKQAGTAARVSVEKLSWRSVVDDFENRLNEIVVREQVST